MGGDPGAKFPRSGAPRSSGGAEGSRGEGAAPRVAAVPGLPRWASGSRERLARAGGAAAAHHVPPPAAPRRRLAGSGAEGVAAGEGKGEGKGKREEGGGERRGEGTGGVKTAGRDGRRGELN